MYISYYQYGFFPVYNYLKSIVLPYLQGSEEKQLSTKLDYFSWSLCGICWDTSACHPT